MLAEFRSDDKRATRPEMHLEKFLTAWSLGLHAASLIPEVSRLLPSLVPMSVYIFAGALISNLTINTQYALGLDILLHVVAPFVFVMVRARLNGSPRTLTTSSLVWTPGAICLTYLVFHAFDAPDIVKVYTRPVQAFFE